MRQVHDDDWHRAERATATVQLEPGELTAKGWRVQSAPLSRITIWGGRPRQPPALPP